MFSALPKYISVKGTVYRLSESRPLVKLETRRIEDLAWHVDDFLETHPSYVDGPRSLTKSAYKRLDPIIIDDSGDLLDGFHRLGGLVGGGETGEIPVIVVYDEDLAMDLSEPGWRQEDALDEVKKMLRSAGAVARPCFHCGRGNA